MKKIASLMLLAGLVMGATSANAATIKATGAWQIDAAMRSQNDFNGSTANDDNTFSIGQRMRTKFEFIANENLKGVLETQIGTNSWGNGQYQISAGRTPNTTATGANGTGNGNLILRKGYIDFKWPNTKVNFLVGYQSLTLPSAFGGGSAILDEHVAGAAAVVPVTENLSLVGGYVRPYDANNFGSTSSNNFNGTQTDAAFLYANVDYSGFNVKPFFAYGYAGGNTGGNSVGGNMLGGLAAPNTATGYGTRAYWGGAAFTMTAFDPFKVMADFNYGKATYDTAGAQDSGRGGWLFDLAVDYTGLSMMTPQVFFAYSSGENKDGTKSERMPSLAAENWAYGSFWMQGGDTLNSSYTTPGSTLAQGNPQSNLGFWAVGLSLKDIKLIDKLSHTFNVIYFKGTNAKEVATMGDVTKNYGNLLTNKDSLVEVDLNSKYQIYEELSLGLDLGYINADFDKTVWATAGQQDKLSKDAYKAVFMLNYSF
ncbi:MAG: outer membrane homotrimeric porin [Humidesulfovibrio sp.]|uniref:outer membrane homotrimeric porin n=1 Tax=Humidesulfovibrio sp. TaxID=2910988 RepID=UPI0027368ABD|nr:outer membrane homotrimeric porin [Humidesulfovibrio sp.]MDP2848872.1 outer membrane homotrimeric porin [Humidesulfovibrio sp.]